MTVAMEELCCYLPAYFRRRLQQDESAARAFWSESHPAAVMFTDISGFTPLANRLAELGPDGAELLARLLNVFYGRLVDMIYDVGGDVIAYAGDAAIAIWKADDTDGLKHAVCDAAQCGWEIQQHLLDYAVSAEAWRDAPEVRLSVKIAIAAGDVCLAQVGGVNDFWQPVLIGSPFDHIAGAGRFLQSGEVVLSPECRKLGDGLLLGERLDDDSLRLRSIERVPPQRSRPALETDDPSPEVVRSFVPRTVLSRMETGAGVWLGDLRVSSVVFVKLQGIDVGIADAAERLHVVTRALQQIMLQLEGTFVHLIQDDKGIIAVCSFGLPPLMHEDDPVRAVAAALAIQRELARLGLESQIGIGTGRLFSGPRGNDRRREYSITGRVANLAARLMGAARNEILCDEQTQSAASKQARFDALPPMHLKGFDKPVAAYRPVAVRRRVASRPRRIAGRSRELDKLLPLLDGARRGEPQILVIEGDAGVGKSTLVDEVCRQATAGELSVLAGGADAVETSTPYFAWRTIVSLLLGLPEGQSAGDHRKRVLDQLAFDPALTARAALLNQILNLGIPESQLVSQLAGRARADNLHDLIARLVNRAADSRPAILVIEDAHWLDSASWRLAVSVVQQCPTITMIVSTRPLDVTETHEFHRLRERPEARHIYLNALDKDDSLALARERLGVDTISTRLGEFVFERTQGNPFFIEELLNYLLESRLLKRDGESCDLSASLELQDRANVPQSIRALITSRIDRLTVPEQLSAKTASVIGRSFLEETVVAIYPNEQHRPYVGNHLREFNRQQLIRLESLEPTLAYAFKHVTLQQVTYDQIPQLNRTALHRSIAAWYESHEADSPANYPLLAHHFGRGGVAEKEIAYLVKAGEHALRGFANREAARAFQAAISRSDEAGVDLSDPKVRRHHGHWHRQLGEANFQLGDLPAAQQQLYQAIELFDKSRGGPSVSARLRFVGQMVRQVIHRTLPWIMTNRQVVPVDADSAGGLQEIALALQRLSELHYLKVDIEEGLSTAIEALNVAERAGRSSLLARAYSGMAVVFGLIRCRILADHYARLAEVVAHDVDDQPTTSYVLMAVSVHRLGHARWDLVADRSATSTRIAQQLQDHHQIALSITVTAMAHCFRAEYESARQVADQVRRVAQISENQVHLAWSHSIQGECLFRLGDARQAIRELRETQRLLEGREHSTEEIRTAGLLAIAYWRAGDRQAAADAVRIALERIERCSYATVSTLEAFSGIVEVILLDWQDRGETGPLQNLLPLALAKLRWYTSVFPIGRPRWLCHRGTLHWLAGRPRRASRDWARSLRRAQSMDLPLEQGLAHYQLGVHSQRDSQERIEQLSQALEIFEQLGVLPELELAKQALGAA